MDNTREKLIELLQSSPADIMGNRGIGAMADYLIAKGVTFATDNNVGHWIIHSSGTGSNATNWAECSNCRVCGSPQWKVCPVCETKMEGAADG